MRKLKGFGVGLLFILSMVALVALFAFPPYLIVAYMGWPLYMWEYVGGLWSIILMSIGVGILYGKEII